jgi:hypothetical protein
MRKTFDLHANFFGAAAYFAGNSSIGASPELPKADSKRPVARPGQRLRRPLTSSRPWPFSAATPEDTRAIPGARRWDRAYSK